MKFLSKIAKVLLTKNRYDLSDLAIVLPSRRASLFLSDQLAKEISRPIWLPPFYSIDDFVFSVHKLSRVNNLELFFDFYSIYSSILDNPHSLEKCYKWAKTLLTDFDEIDRSLVSTEDIFRYLSDVKRIENWHLELEDNKSEIENYLTFFKSLQEIYNLLRKRLLAKKMAYSGLAQRLTAENLSALKDWLKERGKKKIVFIGLDALTISQEKIIDFLIKNKLCEIYWDVDNYFINNKEQESGDFLRKYNKKWPDLLSDINDDFLSVEKKIKIIGATKNINQAKILGNILQEKSFTKNELKQVAIILPNEDLLLTVLESIPNKIQDINVTMGYKLSNHPIISIFNDVLNLYINSRILNLKKQSSVKHFLLRDVIKLLSNPYLQLIINSEKDDLNNIITSLNKVNFSYISYRDIKYHMPFLSDSIFSQILLTSFNKHDSLLDLFQDLLNRLLDLDRSHSDEEFFLEECLYAIQENLHVFRAFMSDINSSIEIDLFVKFFNQIINSIKLNFSGEPLNGLQIMGLLEARTIDFNHVFILSANENNLPPQNNHNSFIPFDVKLKFGIRNSIDFDAIYASIFFNLIKRAHTTYIIYNLDYDSYSSSERSRFINQLIYEIKSIPDTAITITEDTFVNNFLLESSSKSHLASQKDRYVMQKLIDLSRTGFSASTINVYNLCPRQFYYEKIIGVKKTDESSLVMDSSTLGLIIHRSLELLYTPYINQTLTLQALKTMYKKIHLKVKQSFVENNIDSHTRGKDLLAFEAILRIIKSFIKHELELVKSGNKIIIKFLEYSLSASLATSNKLLQSATPINFKGNIDRVDVFNGQYRIIDYKTGFVDSSQLKSDKLSDLNKKPKLLQLLMYSWLLKQQKFYSKTPIVSGIINLRASNFTIQPCIINNNKILDSSILNQFEKELIIIVSKIFDPQETFEHLNRDVICYFCD